ncbi:MAG: HlyU family transcriptional regulator [Rhizobiaceae bacterium]
MGFFKSLFGFLSRNELPAVAAAEEMHEGYRLIAEPQREGSNYRLCGTITRQMDGTQQSYKLIRADMFTAPDDASAAFFRKARQVIREQGDKLFD